jgi:hypothetical protein
VPASSARADASSWTLSGSALKVMFPEVVCKPDAQPIRIVFHLCILGHIDRKRWIFLRKRNRLRSRRSRGRTPTNYQYKAQLS